LTVDSSQERAAVRRRNPRGQGQVLKDQLVDATAKLLATLDQPETLTLRQVAREVGVAPASIYSHFPDLAALVRHALTQRYEELAERMNRAALSAGDPLSDLVARLAAYARWGVEHPGHYRTLFGGRMPAGAVPGSAHGVGADLLESVIASLAAVTGESRGPAGPERRWQDGLLLWTALHGLVILYNDHGELPWPQLDDLLSHLIALHAARPPAEVAALLAPGAGAAAGE
jgi:AcrR family transcriptional regulator